MTEPRSTPHAIVITGATAMGKSELAVEVAERVNGEIISADSRQIYRHMDIGTAKPSASLRARVPHHGLDRLDPDEGYSAGRFARDSWRSIHDIRGRGRVPIVVGGTGFFVRALLAPLGPEPDLDPLRRERLRRYLAGLSPEQLRRWLTRLDPRRAADLQDDGGPQRLARSLEVALMSGYSHSYWLDRPAGTDPLDALVFCLRLPRQELYRRIESRLEEMMRNGLLEEVRRLLDRYPADSPGLTSVGYAELAGYLQGGKTLREALDEMKRKTRRFARRQLTWFRHQLPDGTIWLDATRPLGGLASEIARTWTDRIAGSGSRSSGAVASDD